MLCRYIFCSTSFFLLSMQSFFPTYCLTPLTTYDYSLLLAYISKGHMITDLYKLHYSEDAQQIVPSSTKRLLDLELNDTEHVYNMINFEDSEQQKTFSLTSSSNLVCTYYVGLDSIIKNSSNNCEITHQPLTLELMKDQTCITSIIPKEAKQYTLQLSLQATIESAYALLVPALIFDQSSESSEIISFTAACSTGTLFPCSTKLLRVADVQFDETNECDPTIDDMFNDGAIQLQNVSPLMGKLKSLGSSLFIKYLTFKHWLLNRLN